MGRYTQAGRALAVSTPLGADVLLLEKFRGDEALSEPFHFELDMLAEKAIPFADLLGRPITVTIRLQDGDEVRHFHGLVSRLAQGPQICGAEYDTFISYQAEMVPALWTLTKNVQSRIFQHLPAPEILSRVLKDQWRLDVRLQIQGDFHPREYCVQYRESDFAFVSRLMEEEGIYYFFEHRADGHTLVLANTPQSHPLLPQANRVIYQEETSTTLQPDRVQQWVKRQEIRAGRLTLWDHHFQLPHNHLGANETVRDRVISAGRVRHPLDAGGNERFELYDYPGGYAQRFDGVAGGGGDRSEDLKRIFEDNRRTTAIRLEEETWPGLTIAGAGTCWHFASGHKFTLAGHYDADGPYVLTRVHHDADIIGSYASGAPAQPGLYANTFECIPVDLPFRPLRRTPKPRFEGAQTAVVVGPADEEVHCDKYGRVKVQFHWDRQGQYNAESSCWVRVGQPSAGGGWGAMHLPRIGHEVIVTYLDGDPDRPIIVGSVYNAREMPPFKLPEERTRSGFKSNTVNRRSGANFSGLAFDDKKGKEHVQLHSERDLMINAEHNHVVNVGSHQHVNVNFCDLRTVGGFPSVTGGSGGGKHHPPDHADPSPAARHDPSPAPSPAPASTPAPPSTYDSFFKWKMGEQAALFGLKLQTVFGVKSDSEIGIKSDIVLGERFDMTINPFGLLGLLQLKYVSTPLRAVLPGIGGKVDVVYGMKTDAVYGHKLTVQHGSEVKTTTTMDRLSHFLCKLPPLFTGAMTVLYGALDPSSRAGIATAASCGGAGGLFLLALLASEQIHRDKATGSFLEKLTKADADRTVKLSTVADFFDNAFLRAVRGRVGALAMKRGWIKGFRGGGDGGDALDQVSLTDGTHLIAAHHIQVIGRPADTTGEDAALDAEPSTIDINAMGDGKDGALFLNGSRTASLTAGPAILGLENAGPATGKITVDCGPAGTILLRRTVAGLQKIEMAPEAITIECPGKIVLKAAAGMSTLTLGPEGISLEGLNIKQVARVQAELQTMVHKVQGLVNRVISVLQEIK
jgi:type VI secretion system secreted protein VgrG